MSLYCQPEKQPLLDPFVGFTGGFTGVAEIPQTAEVEFLDLEPGKVFYKKQCRKHKLARQVVTNGVVHMRAKFGPDQLLRIRGWIRREPKAAELFHDENGEVLICGADERELNLIKNEDVLSIIEDRYIVQPFSVDLGEIYKGPQQPVFNLAKSDPEKTRNLFQLIIQLVFINGQSSKKFYSPIFRCCTQPKRPHSPESLPEEPSPDSPDSGFENSMERHKKILVDMLDAKTAHITNLVLAAEGPKRARIQTSNADIAYHLRIKDPKLYGELEEGDIVGFYVDEESGESYIQRLRSDNIHNAVHAGVVSRSYWLEGNKPHGTESKTDTVCVIGMVNVKVVGSVQNGERIYASTDHPGKAIPQSHMPVGSFLRKKHVLLGMAMESKPKTKTLNEVNLVKCFVCVVLDVSRQELLEEIESLYEVNEKRTEEQIKVSSKKTWKRLKCYFAITLVLLGLIIFLLYQWLVPGSMFQYWRCRRGSIPDHKLRYKDKDITVRGIQFTHSDLQDKVQYEFENNTIEDKAYYYLNIDMCAYYWNDGPAGNNIGGRKTIGGEKILSVGNNCNTVYELKDDVKWQKVSNQSEVTCTPIPG